MGVNVTTVPATLTVPCCGGDKTDTPVGDVVGNMQVFRSRLVCVFNSTVMAQAVGVGRPTEKGTARTPVPTELVAVKTVDAGPGVVGLPEIRPVTVSSTNPVGRALPL